MNISITIINRKLLPNRIPYVQPTATHHKICVVHTWSSYTFTLLSTLYTTISHPKLKSRLKYLVTNSFMAKYGKRRYLYIVVHGLNVYFVKHHTNRKTKYTEHDIGSMISFLIDNIFVEFGGRIFQQTVSIPMGLTVHLFLPIYFYTHTKPCLFNNFFVKEKRN